MKTNTTTISLRRSMLAVLVAGTIVGHANAQEDTRKPAQPDPEFVRADTNRDGYVSRDEARRLKDFAKPFVQADANRDGRLDPDEFFNAQSIRSRMQAGAFVEDSVITAKVKAALVRDLDLGGALAVSVETHKGMVVLSGFVDNDTLIRRAGEIAAAIEGVRDVKNSLVVKS